MTVWTRDLRPAGTAVQAYVRDAFKEVLQMVDLPIEGLVLALSWVGRRLAGKRRRSARKKHPLQVVHAMSMVNDHVLRDVGLDRAALGTVTEMSAEEIDGCRLERKVS